jgi:hypothetical protein
MQQLGVEETSASPERFENLHTEMHQLSSSASGNSLTFSINLKASFSERSFANRRRAMTYSEASDEPTTDKAIAVIRRIQDKLTGLDFVKRTPGDKAGPVEALDVPEQVDKLIRQATSNENLCLSFFGWCPLVAVAIDAPAMCVMYDLVKRTHARSSLLLVKKYLKMITAVVCNNLLY